MKNKNLTTDKEFLTHYDEYKYSLEKNKFTTPKSKFSTFAKKLSAAALSFAALFGMSTSEIKFSEPTIEKAIRGYFNISGEKVLSQTMLNKIETIELFGENIYVINGKVGKITSTSTKSKMTFKYGEDVYYYGDISNLSDIAKLKKIKSFILHYNEGIVGEQIKKAFS